LWNSCPEEKEVQNMKNIETLMKKAAELKAEGLVEGQISEELNVSSETVTWLLTHAEKTSTSPGPKDISVDWSMIGKSAYRLGHVSQALSDILYETLDANDCGVDVVVGIALSGLPLAGVVASDLGAELAVYTPSKQMLTKEASKKARGNLSANFSDVNDKECIIIDDVVTSGATIEETVEYLDEHGAKINAIAVLIDKKGTDEIAGVPVVSLLKVIRVN
jgi:orotate phosphoribosyltransferase